MAESRWRRALGARALTVLFALVTPGAACAQGAATAPAPTQADIAFVRDMIGHHRQALEMCALIEGRTQRSTLHLLGERIAVSQRDEIAIMEGWLRHHAPATTPANSAALPRTHEHDAPTMPGMLSPETMAQLAQARGDPFDHRFLAGMIAHHRGALAMVAALLREPANARQTQLRQMAIEIDADQRAEIRRMEQLLAALPPPPADR